jgi:hypothetical protein
MHNPAMHGTNIKKLNEIKKMWVFHTSSLRHQLIAGEFYGGTEAWFIIT